MPGSYNDSSENNPLDGAIAVDQLSPYLQKVVKDLAQSGAITTFQRDGVEFVSHTELEAFSAAGSDIESLTKKD